MIFGSFSILEASFRPVTIENKLINARGNVIHNINIKSINSTICKVYVSITSNAAHKDGIIEQDNPMRYKSDIFAIMNFLVILLEPAMMFLN
jgi:hypothetical protein